MSTARMKRRSAMKRLEKAHRWMVRKFNMVVTTVSEPDRFYRAYIPKPRSTHRRPTWGECGFKEWRDRLDADEAKAFFDRLLGLDLIHKEI